MTPESKRTISKFSHIAYGIGISMGGSVASDMGIYKIASPVAAVLAGTAWELGIQPLIAKTGFRGWKKADPKQILEWGVGAMIGSGLTLLLGGLF